MEKNEIDVAMEHLPELAINEESLPRIACLLPQLEERWGPQKVAGEIYRQWPKLSDKAKAVFADKVLGMAGVVLAIFSNKHDAFTAAGKRNEQMLCQFCQEHPKIIVVRFNCSRDMESVVIANSIRTSPTCLLYVNGKEKGRFEGGFESDLFKKELDEVAKYLKY